MKRKTSFTVLSLVLALVFIFGLFTGCTQSGETGKTTGDTTQAETTTVSTTTAALPIVDIELYNSDVTGLDNPELLKKARILQNINETFRINLTMKTAFGDEYIQKMQLMLAAGNSSDILCISRGPANAEVLYSKGVDEGLFADMGDYVSKDPKRYAALDLVYKDPMWKMMNLVDNGDGEKNVAAHGVVFRKGTPGVPQFNMRILKPLGLSVPTTFDEFVNVLREIKKGNPSVIPFSYNSFKGGNITYDIEFLFFSTHGTGVEQMIPDAQGYFHDYSTSDKTKEVVKIFADLYKEGLIDKEVMTKEAWSNYTDFVTGKTAVITCVGAAMYASIFGEYIKTYPDATIEDVKEPEHPIVGPGGVGMIYAATLSPTYSIVIPKSSKNADRALDLINFLYSDVGQRTIWYGVEGIHYKLDASGNITDFNLDELRKDTGEIYYADSGGKRADWAPMSFLVAMGRFVQIEKAGSFVDAVKSGILLLEERADKSPAMDYLYKVAKTYQDEAFTESPPYVSFVKMSAAENKIRSKLSDIRKKYFVPFYIGEKNIDKEWENYVKEMNDAGILEYEQAYNQRIQETKKKYEKLMK